MVAIYYRVVIPANRVPTLILKLYMSKSKKFDDMYKLLLEASRLTGTTPIFKSVTFFDSQESEGKLSG